MADSNPLETLFDSLRQRYGLPVNQDNHTKTAQGHFYFLELENREEWTKLLYADTVATADLYDYKDQRYLNYSVLSTYLGCQGAFLKTLSSDLAAKLRRELAASEKVHRRVVNISLDDFSEIEAFLGAHIEHF